jgi:hypothetical protein
MPGGKSAQHNFLQVVKRAALPKLTEEQQQQLQWIVDWHLWSRVTDGTVQQQWDSLQQVLEVASKFFWPDQPANPQAREKMQEQVPPQTVRWGEATHREVVAATKLKRRLQALHAILQAEEAGKMVQGVQNSDQ